MKFDPYAFLESVEHQGQDGATRATCATRVSLSGDSAAHVAPVAPVAQVASLESEIVPVVEKTNASVLSRHENEDTAHGRDSLGKPKTWTGRVVSLDEWKRLSEWDKHGSTNKVFNALTWQWEPKNGGEN